MSSKSLKKVVVAVVELQGSPGVSPRCCLQAQRRVTSRRLGSLLSPGLGAGRRVTGLRWDAPAFCLPSFHQGVRALEGGGCSPVPERPALAGIKLCRVSKWHLPAEEIITLFGMNSDAGLPIHVLGILVVLPVDWGAGGEVEL